MNSEILRSLKKHALCLPLIFLGVNTWISPNGSAQEAKSIELQASLKQQLSSDDFADRQIAMQRLWENGSDSDVQAAAQSEDPEVRKRARWIQDQWQLGIRPGTPDDLARLLRASDSSEPIRLSELIAKGQLESIVAALNAPNATSIRQRVQRDLLTNFPQLAYRAVELGQSGPFIELLGKMSYIPIVALRRGQMMYEMGMDPDACSVLSPSADEMPSRQRTHVEILIRWSVGQHDQAISLAREQESELLSRLQLAAFHWSGLVESSRKLTQEVVLPDATDLQDSQAAETYVLRCRDKSRPLALSTVGLYRSDQPEQFDATVKQLVDLVTSDNYEQAVRTLQHQSRRYRSDLTNTVFEIAEALIVVDRPDAAIEVLWDLLPIQASELLVNQARFDRAFEVLGVDSIELDTSLLDLANEARRQSDDNNEDAETETLGPPAFERCLAACERAYQVGHAPAARQAMRMMSSMSGAESVLQRLKVVESAIARGDITLAIELAEPLLQTQAGDDKMKEALFRSPVGIVIWQSLAKLEPQWSIPQRARVLFELSMGKLPATWNRSMDLNRLATDLHEHVVVNAERVNAVTCQQIAEFFQGMARDDWAEKFFMVGARQGDYDSWVALAHSQYRQGNMNAAASVFQTIWPRFPNQPETLVGLAQALRLAGKEDEARKMEQNLDALALDPKQFYDIAIAYQLYENPVQAARYANKVIRYTPDNSSGSYHYRALYLLQALDEQAKPKELARLNLRRLDRVLGSTMLGDMAFYQNIAFDHHAATARDALSTGDADVANRHIQLALRQSPANIDFAEKELVAIRQQGHTGFADAVLDSIFTKATEHLARFPLNANMSNNIAWVAALHDRHLDRALELSMSAVSLFPETFSYRDTLAEVLFRRGDIEQAIDVEANCIRDVPDDFHLHQQLQRFKAAR